jgi:methionine-rich copper-binding protein CopC
MNLRTRSTIGLFFVIALLFAGFPGVVLAHEISPKSSQPEPGQVLTASPAEVVLVFPEEVAETGSTLTVVDASGKAVDQGGGGVDLDDPEHATLRVKLPPLPEGVYEVQWKIILTDGDQSNGAYHFGVGNVTVPTETHEQEDAMAHDDGEIAQTGQSANTSPSMEMIAGGGFLAVVVAAVIIYFVRRRR